MYVGGYAGFLPYIELWDTITKPFQALYSKIEEIVTRCLSALTTCPQYVLRVGREIGLWSQKQATDANPSITNASSFVQVSKSEQDRS